MNNLLSYCGLVDVRINAFDKDFPVLHYQISNDPKNFIIFFKKKSNLLGSSLKIIQLFILNLKGLMLVKVETQGLGIRKL